jgi:hypothetical protein
MCSRNQQPYVFIAYGEDRLAESASLRLKARNAHHYRHFGSPPAHFVPSGCSPNSMCRRKLGTHAGPRSWL